jgi:hypothetical protein
MIPHGLRIAFAAGIALVSLSASADAPPLWLKLAGTYTDLAYKESKMNEKGQLSGVSGELGMALFGTLGVSAGGEYMSGSPQYSGETLDGTSIHALTKDYVRDLRVLGHMFLGPIVISGGVGQRYWYEDLVTSYRRSTQYDYYPVFVTYHYRYFYVRGETDLWKGGKSTAFMSDTSRLRKDVHFKQSKGSGFGAELGCMIPTAAGLAARVFIAYHSWDIKASDVQNDGVDNLVEPDNTTTTLQLGIGLNF